jgi:hypothetical protein
MMLTGRCVAGMRRGRQMHANTRSATVRFRSARDALAAVADNDTPSVCGGTPKVALVEGADEEHENLKFKRRTEVGSALLPVCRDSDGRGGEGGGEGG